jgi:hypothetical protein
VASRQKRITITNHSLRQVPRRPPQKHPKRAVNHQSFPAEVSDYISQIDRFIKQEISFDKVIDFSREILTFLNETEKFVSGKHFSMPGKHLSKEEAISLKQKLKELYDAKIINYSGYKFSIQEVAGKNPESMGDFLAKTKSLERLLLRRILSFSEVL